jgi:hypothetical protein
MQPTIPVIKNIGAKVVLVTGAKVAQPIIPKPVKSPISTDRKFFSLSEKHE